MNVGDRVWLISGGPAMTVTDTGNIAPPALQVRFDDSVTIPIVNCRWFSRNYELQEAAFRADTLTTGTPEMQESFAPQRGGHLAEVGAKYDKGP